MTAPDKIWADWDRFYPEQNGGTWWGEACAGVEYIRADLVAAKDARIEELESKLRNTISHATMGTLDNIEASDNEIGVAITALRNNLWNNARKPLQAEIARLQALVDAGPRRRIYLDLDGVMADFDAHFPAVFGLDHRSLADGAMWEKINDHPSYFEDMPLCPGAADFIEAIRHLNPIVLTACPKTNYQHVAGQKRRWVKKHLGDLTVLPVMGGHNKWLFMHAPGDILIDDYEKNCRPWREAGGIAILHTSFAETANRMEKIVNGK